MNLKILFATANIHKINEVQQMLGNTCEIITPEQSGYTGEIPETGDTLEKNALQKARFIYEKLGYPCFADDTGLEIDALNGAPGVYSARYAGNEKNHVANMQLVLKKMNNVTWRSARFRCIIALILNNQEHLFEGKTEGYILTEARGTQGFGYDPIFRPKGYNCSFAEMSITEKNNLSHRGKAVSKLVKFLIDVNYNKIQ